MKARYWVYGGLSLVVLVVAVFGIRWVTAAPRGELQARELIQSGATRITAYEHFFDLCASVQALEETLDASQAELPLAPPSDRDRILTNITGIRAQRARSVAQYNADARKDYTIGQFRSSRLPYQLDPNYQGEHTSCGS